MCSIAEYFNSLFVVWLALRARQNTVQLIKINQRCYSPKRLIRYISCTGNSDFVFFLNFGLGYNIARIFAGKHRKNLNQIYSVSIVATGDMLELLGSTIN